ncbi:hypothetical protein DFJ74DRAFT_773035 [Hyaloraphidium curvatum]|nr:hypothetical protein DFJ74DRAFT_773035 [Hyaloraphidium curvatum]
MEKESDEAAVPLRPVRDPDPAGPLRLSPADELALFPAGTAGTGGAAEVLQQFSDSNLEDGGASGPAPEQLDAASLVAGLDNDRFLQAGTRLHLATIGLTKWTGIRLLAVAVGHILLVPPTWILNDVAGTFSHLHVAVYTAAIALLAGGVIVYGILLVRWRQLLADPSPLVAHRDGDPACTCPRSPCSGSLPGQAAVLRVLAIIPPLVSELSAEIFVVWTLVFTFGPLLRATPWAIACVTVSWLINWFVYGRLRRRAADILLGDTLARLASCARTGELPAPAAREPYVRLHFSLARVWPAELEHLSTGRATTIGLLPLVLACGVVTAAGAGCVNAWILSFVVLIPVLLVQDMLNIAAANGQIDQVAELYRKNRTRILVAAADRPPAAVERVLRDHAELLDAFGRTDGLQGTFVGFKVTYSVVRGFAVTFVTVMVAMWTLLRGAGVSFTLQTVCPG